MIDGEELLRRVESLKTVAKLPPVVSDGKYTMVVPFVDLRAIIKGMEEKYEGGLSRVSEPVSAKGGEC